MATLANLAYIVWWYAVPAGFPDESRVGSRHRGRIGA